MGTERKPWKISPGDPSRPGVTGKGNRYNFAVDTRTGESPELLFYRDGREEQRILLDETYRTGRRYAVMVEKPGLHQYEYRYRQGEITFTDPAARLVTGEPCFGEKAEGEVMISAKVLRGYEVMPLAEPIPYENMVIYKVHPRGYTMQKTSGVRAKGTFQGLAEKIPYWKELGITSLELMPSYDFEEYPSKTGEKDRYGYDKTIRYQEEKLNYWGYTKGNYFAPKASYCKSNQPEKELKSFFSALHEAGIEYLMDFYFPVETDPQTVLEVLRFWRMEYRVDGFVLMGDGVWMELLARDAVLADVKLIGCGYDMGGIARKLGGKKRLAACHSGFQSVMRRFLRGDEDQVNGFLYYTRENPQDHGEVHYLANHDGFTLADMTSYDTRHNMENGEENRDGSAYNYSWNCGVEGPTRKTSILELRRRQMRNAMLLLFLSQGTPLLYGGDELENSQMGNNNAYCQDNEIGWIDWKKGRSYSQFTGFVKDLIRFRKDHPILHMPQELRPTDYKSLGWPEISYHSERAWFADTESSSRQIGILYCGGYAKEMTGKEDVFIYVIYNMHWNEHKFALPDIPEGMRWYLAIDSSKKNSVCPKGEELLLEEKKSIYVKPRTILVLLGDAREPGAKA